MKRLNIDIEDSILNALKIEAIKQNKTLKVFLTEIILKTIYGNNDANR